MSGMGSKQPGFSVCNSNSFPNTSARKMPICIDWPTSFMSVRATRKCLSDSGQGSSYFGRVFWKASISRLFMNDRTEVQLIAYDLLNQNQVVNFNSSANSIRESRVESLGHYLILNVNYKLGLGSGGSRGRMGSGGMRR